MGKNKIRSGEGRKRTSNDYTDRKVKVASKGDVMIEKYLKQYKEFLATKKQLEKKLKELKEYLMTFVKEKGDTNSKGSAILEVEGDLLTVQRRVSVILNQLEAIKYCKRHKLNCVEKIEQIQEDKFEELVKDGTVPIQDFEGLTSKKVVEAFVIGKPKSEDEQEN